jgi:uncharacterized membrane protein HdeD (DUF308 family)
MKLEDAVLLFVGVIGVILGLVGLAARPDAIGFILGVVVLSMGAATLWVAWTVHRDNPRRRRHAHR